MLRTIVGRIEKRSGVSSASVKAVLDALQYEILQTLADGDSVRLGDLGSFRLTMHGEGASTAKEAKEKGANLIKRVSVRFTKSECDAYGTRQAQLNLWCAGRYPECEVGKDGGTT